MPQKAPWWIVPIVSLLIAGESCTNPNASPTSTPSSGSSVSVTGVSLDRPSLSLAIGDSATLTATVKPSDATTKTITWSSGDASVASVSAEGLVKGLKQGSATITATTKDGGFSASCAVSVAAAGKVATPSFSVPGGSCEDFQILALGTTTSGAVIHYTTDGSTPTSSSASYDSAIIVNKDETVKAIAIKDGMSDSDVASASYKMEFISYVSGNSSAQYVENGNVKFLSKPSDATVININGVKKHNGSIYCVGSLRFGSQAREQPYYWKDGAYNPLSLPAGALGGAATRIQSLNGSLYMIGSYLDASEISYPCWWKDGAFTQLSSEAGHVWCSMVIDGKLYIGGSLGSTPAYWVDGAETKLAYPSSRSSCSVNSFDISNGEVFILGTSSDGSTSYACYWQNQNYVELDHDASTYTAPYSCCACRFGGSLYIGGYVVAKARNEMIPAYWKDGAFSTLPLSSPDSGGGAWWFLPISKHLYITGSWWDAKSSGACYWLDGKYYTAFSDGTLSVHMY